MIPTFLLSEEAEKDITGISEYIAEHNLAASIRMVDRLERACQMLAENPELGETREDFGILDCRSFTVNRYVIFFRPNGRGVDIARILDGSRDL